MTLHLQPGYEALGHIKVDIVGIPAIGADPTKVFIVANKPWFPTLYQDIPNARVFLYDHLTAEERAVEIKPRTHGQHQASVERHAEVQEKVAEYGIEAWADRLLDELARVRDAKGVELRPLLFICHSTGGLVLKKALCHRSGAGIDIASLCIGITFFATPHRGSGILSKLEFSRAVQDNMRLKWEMSSVLRAELSHENHKLELLNHAFGSRALGIPIWNYIETIETELKVLTDADGEVPAKVKMKIVDTQSAEISNGLTNSLMEIEEFNLNTTHVGTARLADDKVLHNDYRDALRNLVQDTNPQQRRWHHQLITDIKNDLSLDLHQFYQIDQASSDGTSTRVWSEKVSLADVIDSGVSQALKKRLPGSDHASDRERSSSKPMIEVRGASEAQVQTVGSGSPPDISVQDPVDPSDRTGREGRLQAPPVKIPETIHTRRPSPTRSRVDRIPEQYPLDRTRGSLQIDDPSEQNSQTWGRLGPREPAPQRPHTFQAPSKKRDKFQWIHVPACVPGFVPKIMAAIEKDKGRPGLHKKVLMDQNWLSNHNRSRHASSHARFVRSFFKLLMPKGNSPSDEILSPSSAAGDPQLALYMPYLHWDTYGQLKARADVLRKRREMKNARPVDRKVLTGRSLEHKLIWQFLNLGSSSLHCRRTLDQYGYPALRDIEARDNDQVLYKKTRPAKQASSASNPSSTLAYRNKNKRRHERKQAKTLGTGTACVLMVDQLWCWVLAEDIIVTFFAPKERGEDDNGSHLQADVLSNILKAVNGDFAVQVDDCYDFAALVVSHSVKALLENGDPSLQIFRVFEEYISELTEDQVKSFKQFRDTHRVEELSVRKGNPLPQFLDNSKDLNNLLELRDIEDELTTIQKLLGEQRKIVTEMLEEYKTLTQRTGKGRIGMSFLVDLDRTLDTYEDQVEGMLKSSDIAQESYSQLLDMKQKHSNIIEAHLAREQTETAAEQSRSVMIFTVITIIFLPLSFFSSVFGMNVQDWSGQSTNLSLGYVLTIMGCVSLGVVIVALLAAFNTYTRKLLVRITTLFWRLFSRPIGKVWGWWFGRKAGKRWKKRGRGSRMDSGKLSSIASWDVEKGVGRMALPGGGWMGGRGKGMGRVGTDVSGRTLSEMESGKGTGKAKGKVKRWSERWKKGKKGGVGLGVTEGVTEASEGHVNGVPRETSEKAEVWGKED